MGERLLHFKLNRNRLAKVTLPILAPAVNYRGGPDRRPQTIGLRRLIQPLLVIDFFTAFSHLFFRTLTAPETQSSVANCRCPAQRLAAPSAVQSGNLALRILSA
jgi:hypothetical protein